MCGIAGIVAYGGATHDLASRVVTIRDSMASRGPDGAGIWTSSDGAVALGHRRLAIIDLRDIASQPMTAEEHGATIVFNGEIYNYRELRERLIAKGYLFRTESDTEVLLHLYAEYGDGMCELLRGMYAFAIYNQATRTMLLARDPFGIKPLYYSDTGREFRFASQVKALLAANGSETAPEPAGYVGYFLWGSVPEPFTLFRGIRALAPGTLLQIGRDGRTREQIFCSIPAILRDAGNPGDRKPISRDALRELLLDSVRHHLVSDVPVAVFLSAGIDSQCITSLARDSGHLDLRTITMAFREYKGTLRDEAPLAEECARRFGSSHTTQVVEGSEFRAGLHRFVASMDQPSVDGLNTYLVSKVAAGLGIKVCLSGVGGDEVFGGYSTFRNIPKLVRLARCAMPWGAGGRLLRRISARWIGRFTSPKYAGIFDLGRSFEGAYLLQRGLFMPWELPRFLPPELVREGWRELQPMARLAESMTGTGDDGLRVAGMEMCCYMRNQLLRDSDWAGMAHSIEIRVPFVDVSLLRGVAPYLTGPGPLRKPFVADACGVRAAPRPKTGFSVPVREWRGAAPPTTEVSGRDDTGGQSRGLRGWARFAIMNVYGPNRLLAVD